MSDCLLQLNPEERLSISLCRLQFSAEQKMEIRDFLLRVTDWEYFVSLANENGIIALCNNNLAGFNSDDTIPNEISENLKKGYIASLARNTRILEHLNKVISLAAKENIKVVLLKGLALEMTLYRNKGLRQMNDLDILVRKEDAIKLRKLLIRNGFTSMPIISPLHEKILPTYGKHLPEMYNDGLSVEIHFSLFDKNGSSLTDLFFKNSLPVTGYRLPVTGLIPDPQLHFLYLIKHLNKHESVGSSQLRLYTDLVILLSECNVSILNDSLFEYAKEAGLEKILFEKLFLLNKFWETEVPEPYFNSIRKIDTGSITTKFIEFLRHPKEHHDDIHSESLLKPLKDLNGFYNKILFITGYLFPSITFMKYRYGAGSAATATLYYPVRWGKLIKLIFTRAL